ncbi:EamA-like transporter family protein [Novipirellula aureliae]|uniref:EamA-like transporter family protein n=1 Tax=Novipirellula aureliae TaxID=2527966 RepID=A0A5C6E1B5_9BACT|nr:EamA family transporter [Novipirellula aureliae]TWU41156.1 EamA-like transporter family protein [Novipirellula aureliae]
MTWIELSAISALLLGFYDVAKKVAVRQNAVPIVLLVSVTVGASLWLPFVVWSAASPETLPHRLLRVDTLTWAEHGLLMVKGMLVGTSWTLAFFALKRLPISIASPIRSTSPVWTIAIASLFLGERPNAVQWIGIVIVFVAFWLFSAVGLREGVSFRRDRGVAMMIGATILGALSSIYDKYLLQSIELSPTTVQAWFSIYLVPVTLPMAIWWRLTKREKPVFQWRSAIFAISPLLLAADMVYFTALADPDALVSIVSVVRRCSVVVSFLFGIQALKEANFRPKLVCIVAILCGVAVLAIAR